MRIFINHQNSTKSERRFAEILKEQHIPFRHRVKVLGKEIDFLIGKYAIEINGHTQDTQKNEILAKNGYVPVHIANEDTKNKLKVINLIKQIYECKI